MPDVTGRQWRLPDPPSDGYDPSYFRDLIKAVENQIRSLQARGRLEASTANISNLPTSDSGLATGDLWNDSGTVKVVT